MASDILPDACLGILLGLCFYRHLSTSSSIACHCRLAWKYFALPGAGDYLPWRDSYIEYRVRRCGLGRSLMRPSTLYRSFLPSACNRTCRSDRITHYIVAWTPGLELFDKTARPSVANSSAYAITLGAISTSSSPPLLSSTSLSNRHPPRLCSTAQSIRTRRGSTVKIHTSPLKQASAPQFSPVVTPIEFRRWTLKPLGCSFSHGYLTRRKTSPSSSSSPLPP